MALARRLIPDRALPNELPVDKLSHERGEVEAYRTDELVHDRITPRMYGFLADAGAAVVRDAARLNVPTLLLVAGDDGLVDARGSRERSRPPWRRGSARPTSTTTLPRDLQRARAGPHARARRSRRLDRAAAQPLSGATTVRSGQAGPASPGSSRSAAASTQYSGAGPSTICRRQALASPPTAASSVGVERLVADAGRLAQPRRPCRPRGQRRAGDMPQQAAPAVAGGARGGIVRRRAAPETAAEFSVPSAVKSSTRYQSS